MLAAWARPIPWKIKKASLGSDEVDSKAAVNVRSPHAHVQRPWPRCTPAGNARATAESIRFPYTAHGLPEFIFFFFSSFLKKKSKMADEEDAGGTEGLHTSEILALPQEEVDRLQTEPPLRPYLVQKTQKVLFNLKVSVFFFFLIKPRL